MKLQVMSDLHLGREYQPMPETEADVVVLAGDICTGLRGIRWAAGEAEDHGKPVVYVMGNHEYYGYSYHELLAKARAEPGVHVLENEALIIGDVRFLGCTLWTDFLLYGEDCEHDCLSIVGATLNDYRLIRYGEGKLRVKQTQQLHRESRAWLESELAKPWEGKTVVVTHHAAHPALQHPYYNNRITAGFVSNLGRVAQQHRIDLWISGHTHANFDDTFDRVRFVSNQRGYPGESVPGPDFDAQKIVKI